MVHNEVFKKFKEKANVSERIIDCWFPNGKNSIRVRLINKADMVFTYTDDKHWELEEVTEFIKNMKEKKK